jgi:hypothetical protein
VIASDSSSDLKRYGWLSLKQNGCCCIRSVHLLEGHDGFKGRAKSRKLDLPIEPEDGKRVFTGQGVSTDIYPICEPFGDLTSRFSSSALDSYVAELGNDISYEKR